MIQLVGGVVHISACIFQLDLVDANEYSTESIFVRTFHFQALQELGLLTVIAVICVFWSSMNTFLYCYFGNQGVQNILQFMQINSYLFGI